MTSGGASGAFAVRRGLDPDPGPRPHFSMSAATSQHTPMNLQFVQDTREQTPFRFEGLPVEVTVATLEAGDYSIRGFERRVAVERKELGDLVSCLGIGRPRFERELARLRGFDSAAVVVEAPAHALRTGRYQSKLDSGAAWQSVLAFVERYRIPIIFCQDRRDAEETTFHLLRHFARDRWRELQVLAPPTPRHAGDRAPARAMRRAGVSDAADAILKPISCHE